MPRAARSAPNYIIRVKPVGAVNAERVDVSDRVTSLTYEDNKKGVDKLGLTVDNFLYQNFTDPIFADGTIIEFSFGYADGRMSIPREAIIVKTTGGAKLKIEAHGKAWLLNTERKVRTFTQMKRSDVARQIAGEYGFHNDAELFIEDTEEVFAVITQARLTDAQLLRDLAHREGYEFFIDHRGFHFRPHDLTQEPRRLFTYFVDPLEGDILEPPEVENDLTAKPGTITAKGIDPKTKKPINAKAGNDEDKGRAGLGAFVKVHGVTGVKGPRQQRTAQSAMVTTSAKTQAEAKRAVDGVYRKIQLSAAKVSFKAIGDPSTEAETLIQIAGIGALSGRYHISAVTHALSKDYTMAVKSASDGVGAPGPAPVKSKAAINKQDAPADGTDSQLQRHKGVDKRSGVTKTTFRPKGATVKK